MASGVVRLGDVQVVDGELRAEHGVAFPPASSGAEPGHGKKERERVGERLVGMNKQRE